MIIRNLSEMKKISNPESRERLIFALDVGGDLQRAMQWVDLLKDHVGMFKVGKESFTHFGPEIVRRIRERGGKVFLDLKFHDIPNTVAKAAEAASELGVSIFNLHALGGKRMMEEAVLCVRKLAEKKTKPMPMMLAVTVLTSLKDQDIQELGFSCSVGELAIRLAVIAKEAGMSGVVSSPQEISSIRQACGDQFIILTPGIRWGDSLPKDDQARTLSPYEAVLKSADYIVVGRPIGKAPDPVRAANDICRQIDEALICKSKIQ
jgi:orotidine-5'-phosphate decarboxylase